MTTVFAHHRAHIFLDRRRVKGEKPIACFTHRCFSSQVVEFQNQISVCLFAHGVLLRRLNGKSSELEKARRRARPAMTVDNNRTPTGERVNDLPEPEL